MLRTILPLHSSSHGTSYPSHVCCQEWFAEPDHQGNPQHFFPSSPPQFHHSRRTGCATTVVPRTLKRWQSLSGCRLSSPLLSPRPPKSALRGQYNALCTTPLPYFVCTPYGLHMPYPPKADRMLQPQLPRRTITYESEIVNSVRCNWASTLPSLRSQDPNASHTR